jgi:hypothetical protein
MFIHVTCQQTHSAWQKGATIFLGLLRDFLSAFTAEGGPAAGYSGILRPSERISIEEAKL